MNTDLNNFQNQIDEIEKKLSAIAQQIAEIEESQSGESVEPEPVEPEGEVWTTIYDKDSQNASENWGYTGGLLGNTTINSCPDLTNFSTLRVWAFGASNDNFYDFDISDKTVSRTHSIILANSSSTTLYIYGFLTKSENNTYIISKINNFIRLYVQNGKTTTVTDYSQNSSYYIRKIEAI